MLKQNDNIKEPQIPKLKFMEICPIDFNICKKQEEIKKKFNPYNVFLDIPYTDYDSEYEKVIKKTIETYDLIPILAEERRKTSALLCNVCETIQESGYSIADISKGNMNVLYELGIIHSLSKKCCILCDSETKIPVDLSGLIINKYIDKEDIEKSITLWIKDNVNKITRSIKGFDELFQVILYQLKREDFRNIDSKIFNLRHVRNVQYFQDKLDRLNIKLVDLFWDEDYRWKVKSILEDIGNEKAEELLIKALKDKDIEIRMDIIDILGVIGDKNSQEPLINCLKEDNLDLLIKTINALGKIGDKKAIDSLYSTKHEEQDKIDYHIGKAIKEIKSRYIKKK